MKLYESSHLYYCSEGERTTTFHSWNEFLEDFNSYDLDLNLIIRWDWNSEDQDILWLFSVQQRKGILTSYEIYVTKNDEISIKEFLQIRWAKIKENWAPII